MLITKNDQDFGHDHGTSWESVECNPTTGRVTQLLLGGSRRYRFGVKTWYLNASLLLPFEELESLDLSGNYLGGWIAPEEPNLLSSRLRKLEVLDLSYNSLDNSILPILGGFSNLKELDISHNAIDAATSAEGIKNLSHLENLHLDGVHLKDAGTVLRALGALSSLRILSLQDNTVEGTITAQDFHYLSKLEQLILDRSSLNTSMGILSSLGRLTSLRLLSSSSTGLIGNLSDQSLCNLVLDISNNFFIGKLPRWIANMSWLVALDLSKNQLDGLIPQELFNLGSLEYLDLSDNNLSGSLPSFFISQ
ncbi:hypothetical protein NL676_033112 [Syzygium grande]|nr:hypothetical protein NL676_033112 [Syzygium grande]